MESNNIPWDEISAKLKNEASADQLKKIQEWLDLSPENPAILSEIVSTWMITRNKAEFYRPNMELNWNELTHRISLPVRQKITRTLYFRIAVAAAVLAVVFLSGLGLGRRLLVHPPKVSYTKIVAPEGNKTQVVLPDSTHVWLNSGSELQYASDYNAQNRNVSMNGECFFDVVKDPAHPFTVRCSRFQVKVYGTRFNVNENNAKNLADVTLISGKVQVLNLNNEPISELKPGEQFVYNNGKASVRNAENVEALTAWLNNMLIFDNQPFEEIIPYLEKWYGVKITLDRSLYYSHNYTFKVKTESLREVLELISFITPIEYQIEGEQVTIKYQKR